MKSRSSTLHTLYRAAGARFRRRRMQGFAGSFGLSPEVRVLDVGGHESSWQLAPVQPRVVMLNITLPEHRNESRPWVVADARRLPFRDAAFDVVFSNSVIEHVGDLQGQWAFAQECRRVGRSYWVQTPNEGFPVEPHLLTPFVHWFPRRIQARLLRNFTVWGLLSRPSREECDAFMREVYLLNRAKMQRLFPDAQIHEERVAGLTKSLVAVKTPRALSSVRDRTASLEREHQDISSVAGAAG